MSWAIVVKYEGTIIILINAMQQTRYYADNKLSSFFAVKM